MRQGLLKAASENFRLYAGGLIITKSVHVNLNRVFINFSGVCAAMKLSGGHWRLVGEESEVY